MKKRSYALLTTLSFPYEEIFIRGTLAESGIKTRVEECICDTENPFFKGKTRLLRIWVSSDSFAQASRIIGRINCYKRFNIKSYNDPAIKSPEISPENKYKKICKYCFLVWLLLFGAVVVSILSSMTIMF